MLSRSCEGRRGFGRTDALALAGVLGVLLALVLVSGSRQRGQMYQAGSLANLHEFAAITSSYQADYAGQFWTLSWPGLVANQSQYPDLQQQQMSEGFDPTAAQAVDIIRRRYGGTGANQMPVVSQWIALLYHHLVLSDYMDRSLPLRFAVSPGDRNRLLWSGNIPAFRNNAFAPTQPNGFDPVNWRWTFSSSYNMPPAFFTPDTATTEHPGIVQGPSHNTYQASPNTIGFRFRPRNVAEVAYPSHKVHLFDSAQWRGATNAIWWGYDSARVPSLLVDGSAHVRATSQANPGFNPSNPTSPFPTIMTYTPQVWEPPVPASGTSCKGWFFYTRSGLRGRDFDGVEVPWVP